MHIIDKSERKSKGHSRMDKRHRQDWVHRTKTTTTTTKTEED
jgi:hypothetical protein